MEEKSVSALLFPLISQSDIIGKTVQQTIMISSTQRSQSGNFEASLLIPIANNTEKKQTTVITNGIAQVDFILFQKYLPKERIIDHSFLRLTS